MNWETAKLKVLKERDWHQEYRGAGYGVSADVQEEMALLAARVLLPQCGETHPMRLTVPCTDQASHPDGQHRNHDLGLVWSSDGRTVHDQLGDITLVCRDEAPPAISDAEIAMMDAHVAESVAESIEPAEDLLETLEMARAALERVERAYHESTSKRITAPLYRPVRDARARCEQSVTALTEAIQVVRARA